MLVLTRKAGESILIGDNIRLTLVRVQGNRVRVGIDAPGSVRIVRGELESSLGVDGAWPEAEPRPDTTAGPRSAVAKALGTRPADRGPSATAPAESAHAIPSTRSAVPSGRMQTPVGGRPRTPGVGDQRTSSAVSTSDSRSDASGVDKPVSIAFWRATRSRASIS